MNWPNDVPYDLAKELEELARYRSAPASSDIWAVFKEWLEKHDVAAPDHALPMAPKLPTPGVH